MEPLISIPLILRIRMKDNSHAGYPLTLIIEGVRRDATEFAKCMLVLLLFFFVRKMNE